MPNSVKTAEGKARQRARNSVGGLSTSGNSGSSGIVKQFLTKAERLEFEEHEEELEHIVDILGVVTHSQVGNSRGMIVTLTIPVEYAHDAVEAHLRSQGQLAYLRIYTASMDIFDGEGEEDDSQED